MGDRVVGEFAGRRQQVDAETKLAMTPSQRTQAAQAEMGAVAHRLVDRLHHRRAVGLHPLRDRAGVDGGDMEVRRRVDMHGALRAARRLARQHAAERAGLGGRHDQLVVMHQRQHVLGDPPHADVGGGDRAGHARDRRLRRGGGAGGERAHDRREKAEHAGEGFRRRGQDRAHHRRRLRRQRRRRAGLFGPRARRDAGGRRRGLGGFGRRPDARPSPRPIR